MKTTLKFLFIKSYYFLVTILVIFLLSDCSSHKKLCSKRIINSKCGCNPYYDRIDNMGLSLDKASTKEVKRCIDNASINGKILDEEFVNLSINGCITSSRKIDSFIINNND